jgi:hypothetical protein
MNKRALTTIEIEAFALSSSTAPDERRQPVSHDGGDYPSKPGDPAARGAALADRHLGSRWRGDGRGLCRRLARPVERLRQPSQQERQVRLDSLNNSFADRARVGSRSRPTPACGAKTNVDAFHGAYTLQIVHQDA